VHESSKEEGTARGAEVPVDGPMLRGVVWVFVFGGIALAGLVMVIAYAVWLVHKASDVMSELGVLAERADQLAELIGQVQVPELSPAGPPRRGHLAAVKDLDQSVPT
jgi:hypothetical protein